MPKIVTDYWMKPGPTNKFDWSASLEGADCDFDGERFVCDSPIGYGATEAEAIADLKEQLEE